MANHLHCGLVHYRYSQPNPKHSLRAKVNDHSFIVNLNYVDKVTKDFVKLKYDENEYLVYTSSRKIGAFKKAFLKFGEK